MSHPAYVSARTHEPRDVAIRNLLDAIGEIGNVVETRTFSGLLLVLKLEFPRRMLEAFSERLHAIRVPLEKPSVEVLHEIEMHEEEGADPDVDLVLDVTFVDGDANLRDVVPNVPG